MEGCIICGAPIIRHCKCIRKDVLCEKGHAYHWSPIRNEFHEGISDHYETSDSDNCCDKKVVIIEKTQGD